MATTTYTVAVVDDLPQLAAWGPSGVEDGPSPLANLGRVHFITEADAAPVEYAPSGMRPFFGADLGCESRWRFTGASGNLALSFRDDVTGLDTVLHYKPAPGTDVVLRWVELTNTGTAPLEFDRLGSAGFCVPTVGGARLTFLSGQWAQEFTRRELMLPAGRFAIGSRYGVPGHNYAPWLAVQDPSGGQAWGVALAWPGSWEIDASVDPSGLTRVRAGRLADSLVLDPGGTLASPAAALAYSAEGLDGLSRVWHTYERGLARSGPRPVLYNSWEATTFAVDAASQLSLAQIAADVGAELFVVDDGWFRGDPSTGIDHLGDWDPAPVRFPSGLGVLADAVHSLGMRFGVWVEPEMANVDSDVYRAHPEWFYRWPTREPTLVPRLRHQLVLDYTRADVRDHVVAALDRLISSASVDFLKWDMNRPITELYSTEPDRPVALAHTLGLYEVLDRLRDRHPDLLLETCSAGGGRLDHGMFRRAHWAWASDNTDVVDRLSIQEGFGHLHAAAAMMCWVTDAPGSLSPRSVPLRFRFHVAMCGALGLGGDLLAMSDSAAGEARELIALYRELRPTVHRGDRYHLGSAADPLFGVQYVHGDDVVVFAFALQVRHLMQRRELRLAGLDPAAVYVDVETGARYSGSLLLHRGLYLELAGDYFSLVTRLRRV